ncbi:MAG: hypothetical protein RLZ22_841, partial [Verrucomicrobiota bacterium]
MGIMTGMIRSIFLFLTIACSASGQTYAPINDRPPQLTREFRGAWIATVHNLDWPSEGSSAGTQQAELRSMLDKLAALKMNAVIFQVRPSCD